LGTFAAVTRLGLLIAWLLAALVAAPAALAAEATLRTQSPEGVPVELRVRDSGDLTCLTVVVATEEARRTAPCLARPSDGFADAAGVRVTYRATPEKLAIVYGILSAGTAELRMRLQDERLISVKPDPAAENVARAYVFVIHGRAAVASVQALDATAHPLGAADLDPRAVKKTRGPVRLMRTREETGRRADVLGFTADLYRPRSLRKRRAVCVTVGVTVPRSLTEPGYTGGSACTFDRRRIVIKYAAGCADKRLLLFGYAPAVVARFTIVTAAGARLPADTVRFHGLKISGRAFVLSRPDPGKLARLVVYARSGKRVASVPLSSVGSTCGSSSRS
jgi:hypothetical protein